jgi:hypothetical protein
MSGMQISIITYVLTIVISVGIAAFIKLIVILLDKLPKKASEEMETSLGSIEEIEKSASGSDLTAVAAAIAVAIKKKK